jgi:hypothetical protein
MPAWTAQVGKVPEKPCRTDWTIGEYKRLTAERETLSGRHQSDLDDLRREVERCHWRINELHDLLAAVARARDVLD